jgi:hypothetical protein
MQDDVSLLRVSSASVSAALAEARKSADLMNLDNRRAEIEPMASALVAEAWARTGKSKEALKLIDSIEYPKKDREQVGSRLVSHACSRSSLPVSAVPRNELGALANADPNHLGRFVMPIPRHPELQKLRVPSSAAPGVAAASRVRREALSRACRSADPARCSR